MMTAKTRPLRRPTIASRRMMRQALARPSSRVASARTATVMVWVPALPPIEATTGISTASATMCSIAPSNSADHAGGGQRRAHVDEAARGTGCAGCRAPSSDSSSSAVDAAERLDVGVRFLLEDVDDVVDHHGADEPVGLVDDGGGDEVVALEQARDLLLVLGRLDPVGLVVHDLLDGHRPLDAQQPVEGDGAEEVPGRVDDEDLVEGLGQIRRSRA